MTSRVSCYKSAVKRELKHAHQIQYTESQNWINQNRNVLRDYFNRGYTPEQTAKVIMHRMRNANENA